MPKNAKRMLVFFLVAILSVIALPPDMSAQEIDPISEIQEKLLGISEEEKKVLEELFTLSQEIDEMEKEEEKLGGEIEILEQDIEGLEKKIQETEDKYIEKRDVLKEILVIYQRKGPASYLEILLSSESLNMFLWRMSTLQDLSRGTAKLLDSLEESREKLAQEKAELDEKLIRLEEKQKELIVALEKKVQAREAMEEYLASLKEEREHYQEQLDQIQTVWNDAKQLFPRITAEFTRIVEEGNLPPGLLEINISMRGIEGTIKEESFNQIASDYSTLPKMNFDFKPGRVEISVPDKHLVLEGTFDIEGGRALVFEVEKGSFYGMPLGEGALAELFPEGNLVIDLSPILGINTLESVEIQEAQLKFLIKIIWF